MSRRACILVMAMIALSGGAAGAQEADDGAYLPDFSFNSRNTLKYEFYGRDGDRSGMAHAYGGSQLYDEYDLSFDFGDTPYYKWHGDFSGLANSSDYRSNFTGHTVERWNVMHQNGEVAVPFKVETGDFFGYFSHRTLQRALKGAMVEFQPDFEGSSIRHSIQLLSGFSQNEWRNVQPERDLTSGASWVMEKSRVGRLGFNYVHNRRSSDLTGSAGRRNQSIASGSFDKPFALGGQKLTLEGEYAHFSGSHNGSGLRASEINKSDNGYYAQFSGRSDGPLSYRLRYENYGRDFQPVGTSTSADQRGYEGHAAWRFDTGMSLRGRALFIRNSVESGDPTDTHTYGINLAGPLLPDMMDGVNLAFDSVLRKTRTRARTTRDLTSINTLDLSAPLGGKWSGRISGLIQRDDDRTDTDDDGHLYQVMPSVTRSFNIGELRGAAAGGLTWRREVGASPHNDKGATFAVNLGGGGHDLRFNYAFQHKDNKRNAADIHNHSSALNYRYRWKGHTFGLEGEYNERLPDSERDSRTWRAAATWTFEWDRPSSPTITRDRARPAAAPGPTQERVQPSSQDGLAGLSPGMALEDAIKRLADQDISGGFKRSGLVIHEARLLKEVDLRQRLALVHSNGKISISALIINFVDASDPNGSEREFEDVRKALIDRYGRPMNVYDTGTFAPNSVDEVNAGRLIRVTEWRTDGGVIRLGIPRRLDGIVRIEVQHATKFPPPREPLWSLEDVR